MPFRLKDQDLQHKLDDLTYGDFTETLNRELNGYDEPIMAMDVECGESVQQYEIYVPRLSIRFGKDEIEFYED